MRDDGTRVELERACDEHERLEQALVASRQRQEELLARFLEDEIAPRCRRMRDVATAGTRDLPFGFEGARARGVAFERRPGAAPMYLLVTDTSWRLIERRAHGVHAVVKRVSPGALLDAFGRDVVPTLLAALDEAERPPATPIANAANAVNSAHAAHAAHASPEAASPTPRERAPVELRRRTRACIACDAHPNEENYARHLRTIHGLDPHAPAAPKRATSAAHEICRLCGARLPRGRLDPHLTAAHGIFHVHPAGSAASAGAARGAGSAAATDARREAAIRSTRRAKAAGGALRVAEPRRDLGGSLAASAQRGRDFLAEARLERTLIARADSPERNRDRAGRFSDAPDVERMDGDSDA